MKLPPKVISMSKPSFEAKKAYFAQTRKSNYAASLSLEGFDVPKPESTKSSAHKGLSSPVRKLNA